MGAQTYTLLLDKVISKNLTHFADLLNTERENRDSQSHPSNFLEGNERTLIGWSLKIATIRRAERFLSKHGLFLLAAMLMPLVVMMKMLIKLHSLVHRQSGSMPHSKFGSPSLT